MIERVRWIEHETKPETEHERARTMSNYTTTRNAYNVTTKHPTGYADGLHAVEVVTVTNGDNVTRRCSADAFGCSRDYSTFAAADDAAAIRLWLTEHACRATAIKSADAEEAEPATAFKVGDVCRVWTNLEPIGGPRRVHQNAVTVTRVTPTHIVTRNEYGCTSRFYRSTCRKVGGDRLTPVWIEPATFETVRTSNAATIVTTTTEGSATTRRRQLDGVEFYFDRRATSTGKAGFVGWFPDVPGLAFEATTEEGLADHARAVLRAMIASVQPTGVDAVAGPVVRVDRTADGFALLTPSGHVIARGDKFALFAYAASRCLFADLRRS